MVMVMYMDGNELRGMGRWDMKLAGSELDPFGDVI